MEKLKQGQRVKIVGVPGLPENTYGRICGIYGDVAPLHIFYIVKMDDGHYLRDKLDYDYECVVITGYCLEIV